MNEHRKVRMVTDVYHETEADLCAECRESWPCEMTRLRANNAKLTSDVERLNILLKVESEAFMARIENDLIDQLRIDLAASQATVAEARRVIQTLRGEGDALVAYGIADSFLATGSGKAAAPTSPFDSPTAREVGP